VLSGAVVYPAGIALAVLAIILQRTWPRTVLSLIAIGHLTVLVSVALFPIPIDAEVLDLARRAAEGSPGGSLNVVPFATIGPVLAGSGDATAVRLLVLNALVLLPAGVYLPLLWPILRRPWAAVPLVVVAGASVELAQLAISTVLGFRYRWIDVDDAIMNAVGVALGWLLVVGAIAIRRAARRRRRRR
jgi:glycopeptide antibiotics resistance protein